MASRRGPQAAVLRHPHQVEAWKRAARDLLQASTGRKIPEIDRGKPGVTTFRGGSHLTLISHPEAVAAVIASAICDTTR